MRRAEVSIPIRFYPRSDFKSVLHVAAVNPPNIVFCSLKNAHGKRKTTKKITPCVVASQGLEPMVFSVKSWRPNQLDDEAILKHKF